MIQDKKKGAVFLIVGALVLAGAVAVLGDAPDVGGNETGGVDDWRYSPGEGEGSSSTGGMNGGSGGAQNAAPRGQVQHEAPPSGGASADAGVGFSAGGAKDINSFRDNIENGYLPMPADLQYEGLFYDYYFDTGQTQDCDDLFCPSYSTAVSEDPL